MEWQAEPGEDREERQTESQRGGESKRDRQTGGERELIVCKLTTTI